MQYAAGLSPKPIDSKRLADLLMKNGFQLVSKEPLTDYDSRDIKLTLFVDFRDWNSVLSERGIYRVVGPDVRRRLFRFENTPFWTKMIYYYYFGISGLKATWSYWWAKNVTGETRVS